MTVRFRSPAPLLMKPTINYDDFEKLDLRVGKVISAVAPEWSEKLIESKVDFGAEIGEKTILSGIKNYYSPEDLIGKSFIFVVNLAERKMGESVSQGMMLMADGDQPVLIEVSSNVTLGSIVR
jgi:methionyl-tRNA synthetase